MDRQLSLFEPIEIPLTRGYAALVDLCDADLLDHRWYALPKLTNVYARRKIANDQGRSDVSMHRVIMSRILDRPLRPNEQVDHINGNGLDNQRGNLRLASNTQNQWNARRRKDNSSGVKGVWWRKASQKWVASINVNGIKIHLGSFSTLEDARWAYRIAANQMHGEYAKPG